MPSPTPQVTLNTANIAGLETRHLRIAVISDAQSERNGVGAYYHDLVAMLAPHVAAIELLCPGMPGCASSLSLPLPGDASQRLAFPACRTLLQRLEALQPDVIITPTPGPFGLLGAYAARRLNARLIAGFHTHFEKIMDLYWSRWFGKLTVQYFELFNRYLFSRARHIVVNSREMEAVASAKTDKPVRLMGTPVANEFLHAPLQPLHDGLDRVLFAGRLAAEKNIETVIDAARRLPGIRFSIAGDGPQRQLVTTAASQLANLDYLGWLPREQLRSTLDAHDLLILPSHIESFGTIAMEAMMRERLVLVSEQCGITEWPVLSAGLFTLQRNESAATALQRIAELSAELRLARARKARAGALLVHRLNQEHWLEMLAATDRSEQSCSAAQQAIQLR